MKWAPLMVMLPPLVQPALVRSVADMLDTPSASPSAILVSGLMAVLSRQAAKLVQLLAGWLAAMKG